MEGETRTARRAEELTLGLTYLAAALMALIGGFHIIVGIPGVNEDGLYTIPENYVFDFEQMTWGWIHIVGGAVALTGAFGLLTRSQWARMVGVVVALASAIVTFMFLPLFTVWAAVIIGVDIAAIWALTYRGGDLVREGSRW